MKNQIKIIVFLVITSFLLFNCNKEDPFADDIFNDLTNYPYVSIQDRNEDIDNGINGGNNFWNFIITPENDGNQIRIAYDSQDPNITSHEVIVGRDASSNPPSDGVVLATITSFPSELIFTKQDIATALGEDVTTLSGNVWFGGHSVDADGHEVEDPDNFENFLVFERHAYEYRWSIN